MNLVFRFAPRIGFCTRARTHIATTLCLAAFNTSILLLSCANAAVIPPPAPAKVSNTAEPLSGTLFFNRAQREKIERTGSAGSAENVTPAQKNGPAAGSLTAEENNAALNTPNLGAKQLPPTINGFVKRSDGSNTVWVDGQAKRNLSQDLLDEIVPMSVGGNTKFDRPKAAAPIRKDANHLGHSAHQKRKVNLAKNFSPAKAQVSKNLQPRKLKRRRKSYGD